MGTDRDWEQWGAVDPYYGVFSREDFRSQAMTAEAKAEFFASGEEYIDRTMRNLSEAFGTGPNLGAALDFGCGVGRLLMPLARRFERATGVDVSPSMIAEARRNCAAAELQGVAFVASDDGLSRISGTFDLVHSYIVLQHIPWRRGRVILHALAERVAPDGCLAVQILAGHNSSPLIRGLVRIRYAFPPANWLRNLFRGRPVLEPAMQLNVYDLDAVIRDLQSRGFSCRVVEEDVSAYRSVFVYARRAKA